MLGQDLGPEIPAVKGVFHGDEETRVSAAVPHHAEKILFLRRPLAVKAGVFELFVHLAEDVFAQVGAQNIRLIVGGQVFVGFGIGVVLRVGQLFKHNVPVPSFEHGRFLVRKLFQHLLHRLGPEDGRIGGRLARHTELVDEADAVVDRLHPDLAVQKAVLVAVHGTGLIFRIVIVHDDLRSENLEVRVLCAGIGVPADGIRGIAPPAGLVLNGEFPRLLVDIQRQAIVFRGKRQILREAADGVLHLLGGRLARFSPRQIPGGVLRGGSAARQRQEQGRGARQQPVFVFSEHHARPLLSPGMSPCWKP